MIHHYVNRHLYFSEVATLRSNDITKIHTFDDMLISIVWIMTNDDGVQVKMPDDGFGAVITLPLEHTKLDDLQHMSEKELQELLRNTMKHAAVETSGNGTDDNSGVDEVKKNKKTLENSR